MDDVTRLGEGERVHSAVHAHREEVGSICFQEDPVERQVPDSLVYLGSSVESDTASYSNLAGRESVEPGSSSRPVPSKTMSVHDPVSRDSCMLKNLVPILLSIPDMKDNGEVILQTKQ